MQKEVRIERQPDTDLRVDQGEYLQTSGREKIKDVVASGGDIGQPRAVLGVTGWRSKQLVSVRSDDVSPTRSTTSLSTVRTINEEDQQRCLETLATDWKAFLQCQHPRPDLSFLPEPSCDAALLHEAALGGG